MPDNDVLILKETQNGLIVVRKFTEGERTPEVNDVCLLLLGVTFASYLYLDEL